MKKQQLTQSYNDLMESMDDLLKKSAESAAGLAVYVMLRAGHFQFVMTFNTNGKGTVRFCSGYA